MSSPGRKPRARIALALGLALDAFVLFLCVAATARAGASTASADSRRRSTKSASLASDDDEWSWSTPSLDDVASVTFVRACAVFLDILRGLFAPGIGGGPPPAAFSETFAARVDPVLFFYHLACTVGLWSRWRATASGATAGLGEFASIDARAAIAASAIVGWVEVWALSVPLNVNAGHRLRAKGSVGRGNEETSSSPSALAPIPEESRAHDVAAEGSREVSFAEDVFANDDDDAAAAPASPAGKDDPLWPLRGVDAPREPWREGLPKELEAHLEAAFARMEKQTRAVLDALHRNSDAEKKRGRPFIASTTLAGVAKEGGRIRTWYQHSDRVPSEKRRKDGSLKDKTVFSPPVNVGIFDAPVSVAHMHRSIGDPSTRPQWDSFCKFGRNVRSFNANCEQNEILFKPIWPVAGRDQQLISARRRLPGGARMYVATSLPPKFQPPKIPGYVRAKLITAGYYVMPRPGGCGDGVPTPSDATASDDASEDVGAVMIISMFHVNLGSVPTSIYWFVSKKFAGVMQSFRRFAIKPLRRGERGESTRIAV